MEDSYKAKQNRLKYTISLFSRAFYLWKAGVRGK